MGEDRWPKIAFSYKSTEQRVRRRPRRYWK